MMKESPLGQTHTLSLLLTFVYSGMASATRTTRLLTRDVRIPDRNMTRLEIHAFV